jgi:valyl-tRNA synthetase
LNALALVGDLKVMVPLAGLIDVDVERARLVKEIDRKKADVERLEKKLGNQNFVAKAPPEVVAKEQQKAEEASAALKVLNEQLDSLRKPG